MEIKKISKNNIYRNKKLFNIHDLDVNKIFVSKKESYRTKNSLKYFIGYNDDNVIRHLCIKLSQMVGHVKHFDCNKRMFLKVNDNKLLQRYTKIWEKITSLKNIELGREPFYGENGEYIKTKIEIYEDRVNTNLPNENASYKCISLIMLGSVVRANKTCLQ